MRSRLSAIVPACLALTLLRCASAPPSLDERYDRMNPPARQNFLALYPVLRPIEPKQEAEGPLLLPDNWRHEIREIRHYLEQNPELAENPASFTLKGMEILPSRALPVTEGTRLELKARLLYADGRRADATHDAHWGVQPALARIEGRTLRFECAHSDVTVSAEFLGERTGTRVIEIRKPLASLELSIDGGGRLRLYAHCADGTRSEVSCQADWRSRTRGIEAGGCGNVRWETGMAGKSFKVTAEYGGLSVTRAFHTPLSR